MAKYKFKVVRGRHSVGFGPNRKTYGPNCPDGNIIETDEDLRTLNSPGSIKMVPLDGGPPIISRGLPNTESEEETVQNPMDHSDPFDAMSIDELRSQADELGIDLQGARRKDVIIDRLRHAMMTD